MRNTLTKWAEGWLAKEAERVQKAVAVIRIKVEGDVASWDIKNLSGGNLHHYLNEALSFYGAHEAEILSAKRSAGEDIKKGLRASRPALEATEAEAEKALTEGKKIAVKELDQVKSKSQQRREKIVADADKTAVKKTTTLKKG